VNDADIVADASAVIALLVGEPFIRFDALRLPNASGSARSIYRRCWRGCRRS
jgi:hypothetical protein